MATKFEQEFCLQLNEPLLQIEPSTTSSSTSSISSSCSSCSSCCDSSSSVGKIKQASDLAVVEDSIDANHDKNVVFVTKIDCWPKTRSTDQTLDQLISTPYRFIGGWKAAMFLLGAHSLQSLAVSGCTVNLVIFLLDMMDEDNTSASNIVTNWIGTSFLMSVIGASIGDSSVGHMRASVVYHILFVMGLMTFALLGSIIANEQSTQTSPTSYQFVAFYVALYAMGIGSASSTPNIVSLGAGQFDSSSHKSVFVTLYIASTNVGLLLATTCVSYVQNQGNWALGFGISAMAGLLSLTLLLFGIPRIRDSRTNGVNPLARIFHVVINIVFCERFGLYHPTLEDVEEVKSVVRLLPFWVCGVLVCSVTAQKSTFFVLQGATMDNKIGSKFKLPSSSMGLFSFISVVVGAPCYSWLIAPFIRKTRKKDLSPIERMGIGLLMAISAFIVAAIVESQRLRIAHMRNVTHVGLKVVDDDDDDVVPMSIFWLVPQYVLEGLTNVFFACGNLDFNYTYSPVSMRSLATAIFLSGMALGNFGSTFLVQVVTSLTSWISDDLNSGHLDYFYWLLDGILLLTFALFVLFSKWHHALLAPMELR